MSTHWTRPTTTTPTIAGGYVLLRSHALLALWQAYADGHIALMDLRSALAAAELIHREKVNRRSRPRPLSRDHVSTGRGATLPDHASCTDTAVCTMTAASCVRKTRASLKRLANAGVPPEQVFGRCGSALPVPVRNVMDIADRPVPFPRRLLRFLAKEGTSALIAVTFAHLLRGSFFRAGQVRLGGTCSAAWVASVFAVDERTAKQGRCGLVERGWLIPAASPVWHRQRYGATFTIHAAWKPQDDSGARRMAVAGAHRDSAGSAALDSVPSSPPRTDAIAPESPPPRKNKNLPLRGKENQDRDAGIRRPAFGPTVTGVQAPTRVRGEPSVTNIVDEDLNQPERTEQLFADAQRRGLIGDSQADRLRFFTTVQHARSAATRPCAMLAVLARKRCWSFGNHSNEDEARRILRELDAHPPDRSEPPACVEASVRPACPAAHRSPESVASVMTSLLASLRLPMPGDLVNNATITQHEAPSVRRPFRGEAAADVGSVRNA